MKIINLLSLAAVTAGISLTAACSSSVTNTNVVATNAAKPAANANSAAPAGNAAAVPGKDEDAPASVKAAFPGAQSFSKQHKDIPKDAIADIEKDTGGKVPDTDHHSYLAFSTEGGARKQIGAATIVNAGGKELVIIYDNKNGSPVIKEVRAEGLSAAFLGQFAGKGHDDDFKVGSGIKANGVDDASAKAIALAIQIDALTMQHLYGAAHSH
jgi:hypothetical protein